MYLTTCKGSYFRDDLPTESQENKPIMKQHKPKTIITKSKEKNCCVGKGKKSSTQHEYWAMNNVYCSKPCQHWLVTQAQFSVWLWLARRDEVCMYMWGGSGQRQLNLHLPLWKTDRLCLKVDYPGRAIKHIFKIHDSEESARRVATGCLCGTGDTRKAVFITRIVRHIVNLPH